MVVGGVAFTKAHIIAGAANMLRHSGAVYTNGVFESPVIVWWTLTWITFPAKGVGFGLNTGRVAMWSSAHDSVRIGICRNTKSRYQTDAQMIPSGNEPRRRIRAGLKRHDMTLARVENGVFQLCRPCLSLVSRKAFNSMHCVNQHWIV